MLLYIHIQLCTLCFGKVNDYLAIEQMLGRSIIKTLSVDRSTLNRVSVFVFLARRTPIADHLQLVQGTHVLNTVFVMLGMVSVLCVVMLYCWLDRFKQREVFIGAVRRVPQLANSASKMFGFGPAVL